jgi:Nucleoside 2-deoxyribosyltransferase
MLIGLCGVARSGKDSAAGWFVERGYTKLAFADGVRQMALGIDPYVHTEQPRHYTEGGAPMARYSDVLKNIGYENAKALPDVRRLLQRCGTEGGRDVFGPAVWVNAMHQRLCAPGGSGNVVISDVRFQNEAEYIRASGGFVIRLNRPGYGGTDAHASEAHIATLSVDAEITASNLDELFDSCEQLIEDTHYMLLDREHIPQPGNQLAPPAPRVYLAGSWKDIVPMGKLKQELVAAGIDVISDWTERERDEDQNLVSRQQAALIDFEQVRSCNTLVIVNAMKSEGKASEMGMALALGKRIILVGPRDTNVFYDLPQVEQVATISAAIELLGGVQRTDTGTPAGIGSADATI